MSKHEHIGRYIFPPLEEADEYDGLLAVSQDLCIPRVLAGYQHGAFPWFEIEEGGLFAWFAPNPRCVLFPEKLTISKSMQKVIKDNTFTYRWDTAFEEVLNNCASVPRKPVVVDGIVNANDGTWINQNFKDTALRLHELGLAHSAEAWQDGKLVGGLYGMLLDDVFFGESMFSTVSNASKFAFIQMVKNLSANGLKLIDCQSRSQHLISLGAQTIPSKKFKQHLKKYIVTDYQEKFAHG
jgi:leucyl/phenylalanyl-tRNA---protein transferase